MADNLQTIESEVAEIYISTFGRAPDKDGLAYWTGEVLKGNLTMAQVSESFFDQSETQEMYGNSSNLDFLISIYENTLGKTVDSSDEGVQYWLGQLDSGELTQNGFVKTIINGAKAETGDANDALLLQNKVNTGLLYAKEIGVTGDLAKQIMNDVTYDPATAENAMGMVEYYKGWVGEYSTALGDDSGVTDADLWANINDATYWNDLGQNHTLHFDAPPPINFWEQTDAFWADGTTPDTEFAFLQDETM